MISLISFDNRKCRVLIGVRIQYLVESWITLRSVEEVGQLEFKRALLKHLSIWLSSDRETSQLKTNNIRNWKWKPRRIQWKLPTNHLSYIYDPWIRIMKPRSKSKLQTRQLSHNFSKNLTCLAVIVGCGGVGVCGDFDGFRAFPVDWLKIWKVIKKLK